MIAGMDRVQVYVESSEFRTVKRDEEKRREEGRRSGGR